MSQQLMLSEDEDELMLSEDEDEWDGFTPPPLPPQQQPTGEVVPVEFQTAFFLPSICKFKTQTLKVSLAAPTVIKKIKKQRNSTSPECRDSPIRALPSVIGIKRRVFQPLLVAMEIFRGILNPGCLPFVLFASFQLISKRAFSPGLKRCSSAPTPTRLITGRVET